MKSYLTLFIILTVLTGLVGFAGAVFPGIEVVRVLFLIFADLLIISVLGRFFFAGSRRMELERIKK
jgi:uncharacterized membrane protein YtjA (UPF0391 family)